MSNTKRKIAIITGITGMDGSHMADLLLSKGYEVHGFARRLSFKNFGRIEHIKSKIHLHYVDLMECFNTGYLIKEIHPNELYNFAAQSHVGISFNTPVETMQINAMSTIKLLDHLRVFVPTCKFYQASTSEMYGGDKYCKKHIVFHGRKVGVVDESVRFDPKSPYGVSKVASFFSAVSYREIYNLHVSNGISFNHESERRGSNFVTQKIVRGLIHYRKTKEKIHLGNIFAMRDWGYAPDYVYGIYKMVQQDVSGDYILATGNTNRVIDFLIECCKCLHIENFKKTYVVDKKFFRPLDVEVLCGDSTRAYKAFGWSPRTSFSGLVKHMVSHELSRNE